MVIKKSIGKGLRLLSTAIIVLIGVFARQTFAQLRPDYQWRLPFEVEAGSLVMSLNGRLLALRSTFDTIAIWDSESESLQSILSAPFNPGPLSFSPKGDYLAVGSQYGTYIFSVKSRQVLWFVSDRPWGLSFSPDGNYLALLTSSGVLRVYRTLQDLFYEVDLRQFGAVRGGDWLSFSPSGREIIVSYTTNNGYGTARLDIGESVPKWQEEHYNGQTRPAFSPDGRLLAFHSATRLRVLSMADGSLVYTAHTPTYQSSSLAFSTKGDHLYVFPREYARPMTTYRVADWSYQTSNAAPAMGIVEVHPSGKRYFGNPRKAIVGELPSGAPLRSFGKFSGFAWDFAFVSGGNGMAVVGEDTRIFDSATGKVLFEDSNPAQLVANSARSDLVLSVDGDGGSPSTYRLYEKKLGTFRVRGAFATDDLFANTIDIDPGQKTFAVGLGYSTESPEFYGTVVRSLYSGKLIARLPEDSPPIFVAYLPQRNKLLVSTSTRLSLWNYATQQRLRDYGRVGRGLALSPDSTLLAVFTADRSVRFLRLSDGVYVGPPMLHDGFVNAASFSPDGTRLLTSTVRTRSADKIQISLWSVKGSLLARYDDDVGQVWKVAFHPGGILFGLSTGDPTIAIAALGN